MNKSKTIIISGGGSGGHIYPALAVASELEKADPQVKIVLVGAQRGLEREIFSKTSYKSYFIPVGQLHSSVGKLKQIWSVIKLPLCFLQSFFIVLKHNPKAVLGVGGYASGPVCLAARLLNIQTFIWEGNATPGITNKILGRFKVTPFLVFEEASKYFKKTKPVITGVPVRCELEKPWTLKNQILLKNQTPATFNEKTKSIEKDKDFCVLFVGGSQGAKIFNETLPELVKSYDLKNIKIIHQTGLKNHNEVLKSYGDFLNSKVEVLAYLDPIRDYYQQADLIVSRCGAGAVNELSLLEKPSVLVPFPKASDDHQAKNALALEKSNAAVVILEKDFNAKNIFEKIQSLKNKPFELELLSTNIKSALKRGAREEIAKYILESIK